MPSRHRRRQDKPPPPPPMPPEFRRRDEQPQRSSSPPPRYMPPGRRRRDEQPERSSPPRMPPERHRRDPRYSSFCYRLPSTGQEIRVYKDMDGVLVTDYGGSTRPVADVVRDTMSDHRTRPRDPPPPAVDDSDSKHPEEDQQMATPIPGTSQAQYVEEDQPAPAHKLEMAQRRKELLHTRTPEESSLTNAPSSSLPQSPSRKELLDIANVEELSITSAFSSSLPQCPWRKELLDTTKLEELSITNASSPSLPQSPSRKDLLETTKLEELPITNISSSSLPQSPLREDRETNVLKESLDTTTLDKSCITSVSSSLLQSLSSEVPDPLALKLDRSLMSSSFVSSLVPTGLFIKYFVRVDKGGFFHTYPDRGGPFQTLQEAQEAIDSYHIVQRKMMCMNGLSEEERAVRNALYWYHDGTRKHSAEAFASCTTRRPIRELLKALLDRHNEDNDLLGDDAYELKDIVRHNSCFDEKECIYRSYYSHFNLTMGTKGADANNDLYFAEVTCMSNDYEAYVLTCICVVKPDDNGECLVCEVEMEDMKHPTDDVYNHGCRPPPMLPVRSGSKAYGVALFEQLYGVRDEAWLIEEEARVRRMIKEGKEARRSKVEVDRGVDMIKEGKEPRRKLEVDKMLKVASRKLLVDNILEEIRARRSKLEVDNRWDVMIKEGNEAMWKLEADNILKVASRKLKVDNIVKEARRRKLEVDNRGDGMIKKGKEARRSKLEVGNIGDDMLKEGKEATRKFELDNRRDAMIKEGKEAWRSKLEVETMERDKYVVPARRK